MMLASYGLSKRENEVTQLVLLGLPVKRIAHQLGGQAWAVGTDTTTGADHNGYMLHWTGSAWELVSLPGDPSTYRLSDVRGFSASNVWAVGDAVIVHC